MKRPQQHQIDQLAQNCFKGKLPPNWIPRDQKPDYGVDYLVEISDKDILTGLQFGVQLKGKKRLEYSKTHVSISVEVKHLVYYVDQYRLADKLMHQGLPVPCTPDLLEVSGSPLLEK